MRAADTHLGIDHALCGRPVALDEDTAIVELDTTTAMAVDGRGLVHGGFVFGLADHAAMLAVNHPNVVLGGAETKFLKPVVAGERLVATARVGQKAGKKHLVTVSVTRGAEEVLQGSFTCYVLDRHVLDREGRA